MTRYFEEIKVILSISLYTFLTKKFCKFLWTLHQYPRSVAEWILVQGRRVTQRDSKPHNSGAFFPQVEHLRLMSKFCGYSNNS